MKIKDKKQHLSRWTSSLILSVLFVCMVLAAEPQTYDLTGMDILRQNYPELSGKDIKICIVERSEDDGENASNANYKPDTTHPLLSSINLSFGENDNDGISYHSTTICSIIAGSGEIIDTDGQIREYLSPLYDADIKLLEYRQLLSEYLLDPNSNMDADIISASFGSAIPDWWTRGMQQLLARDNIVGVASIGNGGEIFGGCLYPAAGANFIAVGIADKLMMPKSESPMLDDAAQSSFGKTFEGMSKPDVVCPGNFLAAEASTGGLIDSGSYSSFAAPAAAAITGLIMQRAKENGFGAAYEEPSSNCVIKAILMSSASKGAFWHKGDWDPADDHTAPLDSRQGCGIVNAAAAIDLLNAGQTPTAAMSNAGWDNAAIDGRTENTYSVKVSPKDSYISATLVWNRKFGAKYPFDYLPDENVDLRLELWARAPGDPNSSMLVDYSDSAEGNVEHIFYPLAPVELEYELVVVFSDNEQASRIDISQPYGLAFTTTKMPEQWEGNWLDFDGDGQISLNDLQGVVEHASANAKNEYGPFNNELINTMRVLLNEIAQRTRFSKI